MWEMTSVSRMKLRNAYNFLRGRISCWEFATFLVAFRVWVLTRQGWMAFNCQKTAWVLILVSFFIKHFTCKRLSVVSARLQLTTVLWLWWAGCVEGSRGNPLFYALLVIARKILLCSLWWKQLLYCLCKHWSCPYCCLGVFFSDHSSSLGTTVCSCTYKMCRVREF